MLCKNIKSYDVNRTVKRAVLKKKLISVFDNMKDMSQKSWDANTDIQISDRYMQRRTCVTRTRIFVFAIGFIAMSDLN